VVLTDRLPVDPAAFDRFHFLGSGWTVGLAAEAALKLREAGRAWTESYPAMEYRHGPIATADPRTLVVAFDPLGDALAGDIRATGARLLDAGPEPLATLVLCQRMAVDLAVARGFDPDTPRNLTRSVVLS
jgi:fructoselysine-6-P-deglycase FrlB-like protein